MAVRVSEASFTGPIPDPDTLARYEQMMPGLGNRVVKMAEEQGAHRRQLQRESLEAQIGDAKADRREARVGQILALVIGLTAIVAGTYAAVHGAQWPGGIIGGGGVIGLVSVFILGRRRSEKHSESEK